MNNDPEAERIAGRLVHFICLDANKSSSADFTFKTRCHFLPKMGERIEYKQMIYEVVRVYHKMVQMPEFDIFPCAIPNVVCRFIGRDDGVDEEVKALLRSLNESHGA